MRYAKRPKGKSPDAAGATPEAGGKSARFMIEIDDACVKCSKCKKPGEIAITKADGKRLCRECIGGFPLKGTVAQDRARHQQNVIKIANSSRKYGNDVTL